VTAIGLFKTEVIRRRGPWRSIEAVETATLERVDCLSHRRLLEPTGDIPPPRQSKLLRRTGDPRRRDERLKKRVSGKSGVFRFS
jgi:hypothetical protein